MKSVISGLVLGLAMLTVISNVFAMELTWQQTPQDELSSFDKANYFFKKGNIFCSVTLEDNYNISIYGHNSNFKGYNGEYPGGIEVTQRGTISVKTRHVSSMLNVEGFSGCDNLKDKVCTLELALKYNVFAEECGPYLKKLPSEIWQSFNGAFGAGK